MISEIGAAIRAAKVKYQMNRLKMSAIGHTPQGFGFGRALDAELLKTFGVTLEAIEARNIAQWFSMEDEGFRREMDDIIDEIARAVVNAGTMVDPDRVVIYGEMFELPGVMERFIQYCGYYDPVYGDGHIIKSGLGDRISYIGPLAVVVNEMFFNSED